MSETGRNYNAPNDDPSTIGTQIRTDHFVKRALIEARKEQYFMQLADVTSMPKNMGKKIKKYHYLPLLDDANVNDQGLDAAGAVIANGNLYGSSKDVGTIPGKFPTLTENGGRVNRVGFKRIEVEGSIEKFGFFEEYTQESVDFDSDADLQMHINREMVNGATEITEDALQIDLLNSAGVVKFAGDATADDEVDGDDVVTYADLLRLSIDLDNNRTPKQTKLITGTRLIDTRTIAGARALYIGSELQPTLEAMTDLHGNPAFVPVHQYAAGATIMNGEIGSVGYFRVIVVPEMMHWAGAGADATGVETSYETGGAFDVFPMLCVGEGSFTTIGFQTDGKTVKFKITHKAPGIETADRADPYGETGFMSIKWYYGFLLQRPERIGLIKTSGQL
jgi:N4-gp56 family major capsid protein